MSKLFALQIGFEGRPTRLHNFQLHAERLRKAHRHVHVDAFDLAGSVSERERPVVLGQTHAKNASSNDRVEARGCLGVGGTDEGGQKQAGEKARSKSDGTLKKCKGHGNLGPPLRATKVAASGGQSQLARAFEGSARRPQPPVELKRPDGAELDRRSIRVSRVDQDIERFGHDP